MAFENKSPGEPCADPARPLPPLPQMCKIQAVRAPWGSQGGGGELLHPPLCQDRGLDGLQLGAGLGAVQC